MPVADALDLGLEVRAQARRKKGRTVVLALATADHDPAAVEVDVLDPDAQALGEPEPAAIEEVCDEAEGGVEMLEDEEDLPSGEDRREMLGPVRPLDAQELGHGKAEDVAVQKDDGTKGLVLGGSRRATLHREVIEECGDVGGAQDVAEKASRAGRC